jgi:hypothetical protein
VTSLFFCQNDSLKGESLWQKDSLVTSGASKNRDYPDKMDVDLCNFGVTWGIFGYPWFFDKLFDEFYDEFFDEFFLTNFLKIFFSCSVSEI